jgi:hypothetical protein
MGSLKDGEQAVERPALPPRHDLIDQIPGVASMRAIKR